MTVASGLPAYRMPAPGRAVHRARASLRLGEELIEGLEGLAKAHDTDLDRVLLAGYLAVQSRYTGEPQAAADVGGGLVVTVEIEPQWTIAQLVACVRDTAPHAAGADEPELVIEVRHDGPVVILDAVYDADLFDHDTVDRLLGHINMLLSATAADPDGLRLGAAPILTDAERQLVLVDWNGTETDLDHDGCLHERFAARAAADPDAPALIHHGVAWSAGALDAAANRLAHHLRELGVGVRSRVALCVDRGPNLLTAILGVLKAGGAYVPLDADYPAERLAFMQRDSACEVLVTESGLLDRLPAPECPVVLLDRDAGRIAAHRDSCPEPVAGPDDLCYVIYTSGSTGEPKGIALRHRGVLNNLLDLNTRFRVAAGDKVLALSSTSFDMSVYEFLGITLAGGAVVVPDAGLAKDPAHWHELVRRHGVTVWNSAPALVELYVAHLQGLAAAEQTGLRLAMLGGDWVKSTLPDRLRAFAPQIRVIVMGGATESSIHSTIHEAGSPLPGWNSIPYGRPMANQRTYILDTDRRPVPVGVPGELHLAGVGLAEGYLGRAELTAEKFFDWSAGPVADRLYRTGDLARFRPDGLIELLGRIDFQTKIRGLRVELGEIEARLRARPQVGEAVVCVGTDVAGDRFLAAYVVAGTETAGPLDVEEIRTRIAEELPDYMVPAVVTELDRLPVTPNGKLDRAALVRMAGTPRARTTRGTEPHDETQVALAGLWSESLGVEEVFLEDGFVALGGHSLKAVRLASRIRETLGATVTSAAVLGSRDLAELAATVREAKADPAGPTPDVLLTRRESGGPAPLSFAQERLWYLDRLAPGTPAYNVAVSVPWHADLDVTALRRALDRLIERHEALRTRFVEVDGQARQIVDEPWRIEVPIEEVESGDGAIAASEAAVQREAGAPFSLSAGPLLRARVIRAADGPQTLVLTMHHIVTDGWSLDIFYTELGKLYAAEAGGERAELSDLPISYVDYALWQRAQQESGAWAADLAYWRETLAGAPTVLELPSSRTRPAQQSFRGGLHHFRWDRALQYGLAESGRRAGVTPHMIVLAGFAALLGRHTGESDLVVGAPAAMRTRPQLESLLGFFVNTLPLRVDLSGDPAFGELLTRVRDAALGAVAHQDLPFERLVDELRPQRDPARMPLVQFLVQYNDVPLPALTIGGHRLQARLADPGAAKADLALIIEDHGDGLDGSLEYNADVLDASDAARFAGQLRLLLEQVSQAPETRLGELTLLDDAEHERIVRDWNRTETELPDVAVHRLFESFADTHPDLPAVVAGDRTLTYRQLDRRANRVANRLRRLGVRPADRVGLCMERTPDLIAAMLGILKAGAAYVPLDPQYPAERLAFMADDSGLHVVVTQPETSGLFAMGGRVELCLDGAWDDSDAERPDVVVARGSVANVIYTSGSTGRPKGVVLSHRGIVRLVRGADYLRLGVGDRVVQAANTSFDAATFEIWTPLANGGCLVILPREVVLDPDRLAAALAEQRVATMFLTTAAVNAVVNQRPGAFGTLRELFVGGEALDPGVMRRILEHGAPSRLINVYGPTEATTYATWYEIRDVPADAAGVPIGRPIANTEAYVLDAAMRPVPVGMPGELHLGGPGLALGYLGRPALTAERFVPHPFAERPGERLYRTGDIVRFRADGAMEFLGRQDGQVKIRGFRVEVGEVEAALASHPAVARTAVIVDAGHGEKRLAAFVEKAVKGDPKITAEELRTWLRRSLPEYLVPSVYVLLDALPITPNGKVDRRTLRVPEGTDALASGSDSAPRTPVEEILTGIWAETLGVEQVPADGDFFELGGHSLLAIPLMSRVNAALGTDLPIRALMSGPNPRALAAAVASSDKTAFDDAGPIPRWEPGPDDRIPLSFAQQRLWFMDQLEPDSSLYNVPIVLRLRGGLDRAALERALNLLIRRHEALRTSYPAKRGVPRQQVAAADDRELPFVDLTGHPDAAQEAARLAAADAVRPFDLATGPVLRARLVRLAPDEHQLVLVLHHIAIDGWSVPIVWNDLGRLYVAEATGESHALPELPFRYTDYARWQREWLQGERLERLVEYWRGALGEDPVAKPLPSVRPARRTFAGAVATAAVDAELTRRVRTLGRRAGATEYMVLLAAFQVLLADWTGEPEVTVGTPVAGRGRPGLDALVGCFINMLPVRTSLADSPDFPALLARVRHAVLGALAHEDLPFDKLVEALVSRRGRELSPLFRVMFNYIGAQEAPDFGPALRAEGELRWTGETAMFDLGLVVEADADGLRLTLPYATDLYSPQQADALLAEYVRVLSRLVGEEKQDPDRRMP
ncbi:MAG TPA: amino acid adenylation domain-containing protein [Actinocrinis sp.]|uniref:non-ribosomal peptide synthetase n=1 Tax=Actinocrinis sp. TaxID=1920516 RepID=UPI002DDD185B|nr:non-ribosomal peptide synthetase [Actinocrinis sp.]HEV2348027.1 amino acid adenylation domain-containing protein [Actinocrinis sp.]